MQRDSPMFINGASGPEMDLPSRISGSAHFVCFVVPGHMPVPTTRCAVPITRSDNCLCNCNGFRTRNNDSCQKRSSLGVGAIGGCAQQRCRKVCVHWPGVVQVRMSKTYAFPFGHVHWLCNSFFVMHVTHNASGREPLPPTTDSSTIFRRGAARGVVVDKCIGYAIRFL
jgi:hypothetical protein